MPISYSARFSDSTVPLNSRVQASDWRPCSALCIVMGATSGLKQRLIGERLSTSLSRIPRRYSVENHSVPAEVLKQQLTTISIEADMTENTKANSNANVDHPSADLIELLSQKVVGQSAATQAIVPYVYMYQSGLAPEGRPAGVFLLLGPTGTGKT